MRAIACANMLHSGGVPVFRHESVAGLGHPGRGIPGSPTGLEDLTPDVVPLWVASGDEYPTLHVRKVRGLLASPLIMRPQFAGVSLTRGCSGDPEVLEIRTMGR